MLMARIRRNSECFFKFEQILRKYAKKLLIDDGFYSWLDFPDASARMATLAREDTPSCLMDNRTAHRVQQDPFALGQPLDVRSARWAPLCPSRYAIISC
jgi:hypothetical protein